MNLRAARLNRNVVRTLSQAHLFRDPRCGTSARHVMFTSWRPSPRSACAPWRAGGEAPHGHHGSSSGRESHGCAYDSCYAADRYASRVLLHGLSERRGYSTGLGKSRFGTVSTRLRLDLYLLILRRSSGVHLWTFWACNPKSASVTNAGFPRLWTIQTDCWKAGRLARISCG